MFNLPPPICTDTSHLKMLVTALLKVVMNLMFDDLSIMKKKF